MGTIARHRILLIVGIIACSAALSTPNVQSWAENEKLSPPQKLTGRDAANALVGNTVVWFEFPSVHSVYFASEGAIASEDPALLKWSIRSDQICFDVQGPQAPSEICQEWEVEGPRATMNVVDVRGGHRFTA